MEIIVALETAFDFEFDDDMLLMATLPDITAMTEYIERKLENDGK